MPGLPIQIVCANDATVSFNKMFGFKAIVDQPESGVQAIICDEDITIGVDTVRCKGTTVIEYGVRYQYKDMPELLSWLVAQKMPVFN